MNIAQGILPFNLIEDRSGEVLTSFGGLPLVMETFRALGLPDSIKRHLSVFQRKGRFSEVEYVEGFVSLFAAGGDCLEDFEQLRSDEGIKKLGLKVPSPEAARYFLNAFCDEEHLSDRPEEGAFIPDETELLRGLGEVNKDLIRKAVKGKDVRKVTIDLDATIVESNKREAFWTYNGVKGYQPVTVYWVEEDLNLIVDQMMLNNKILGVIVYSICIQHRKTHLR